MHLKPLAVGVAAILAFGCTEEAPVTAVDDASQVSPASEFPAAQAARSASRRYWRTDGNATTEPPFFFLGTTDSQPLVIKTNGAEALRVAADGHVGIGTASPTALLHVSGGTTPEMIIQETRPGGAVQLDLTNTRRTWTLLSDASPDEFYVAAGGLRPFTILGGSGYVGLGTPTPGYPLEMASGAHVTVGGVWTDASSRSLKENIHELTGEDAHAALHELTPVRFNYKSDAQEDYVGFIAEDVPALVAMQDRQGLSPMEIVAVLTKIVQEQEEKIAQLEARLDSQR